MKLFYFTIVLTMLWSKTWAQNVTFKSQVSSQQVRVGEHFKLGFYLISDSRSISVDSPIDYPNLKSFRVLDETNVRNFQVVNGQMQSSSGLELVLLAEKEGNYRIGPAKVVIDGRTYSTRTLDITVIERSNATNQAAHNQGVFLSSEVTKKNPYVNEAINLSVKLYATNYNAFNRVRNFKPANLSGFDAKTIPDEEMGERMKQEMINGRYYISEELVRYLLFPQDAGNLKIGSFTADLYISGYYGADPVKLSSEPIHLKVKSLPAGKPKNFSGAVGNFTMQTTIDKTNLNQEESANIAIEISGEGNLNNIALPSIRGNEHLEIYPPQKHENLSISSKGYKGKISEKFVVIPQYGGEYHLDPIEFSYFNPTTEKYVTLTSKTIKLAVNGNPAPVKVDSTAKVGQVNDYLANIGKESSTLPTLTEKLPEKVEEISGNIWIWLLGGIMVLVGGIVWYRKKNTTEKNENILEEKSKIQSQKNNPKPVLKLNCKKDLQELKTLVHEPIFYTKQEELLMKIGQNLTHLDVANFTDQRAITLMKEAQISEDFIVEWHRLLSNARRAKYGAMKNTSDSLQALSDTESLIRMYQAIG
ncbi:Uncharacterised protein [Weeksella virosa]|uniref:Aerotolerance-related exported protein n=2 Tax=Weeksella virosa TaxID=1014 RepID=F0P225_WEEVC|nr:hypothetical protein Weevi_1026 [Weeksella virosa DSM 16922]SUP54034.1 Uncharacterised protein [Weeksella virosa]VEH64638.1 Uncharacterised protein [Weeksella virosa]